MYVALSLLYNECMSALGISRADACIVDTSALGAFGADMFDAHVCAADIGRSLQGRQLSMF